MQRIKGLNKTLKALQNASKEVLEEVAIETEIFASECVVDAQRLCPVDLGKLRQSIHKVEIDNYHYKFIAREKYAPYIEFGTGTKVQVPSEWTEIAIIHKGNGVKEVNINPQPFMYPSFIKNRSIYINKLKKLVKK